MNDAQISKILEHKYLIIKQLANFMGIFVRYNGLIKML